MFISSVKTYDLQDIKDVDSIMNIKGNEDILNALKSGKRKTFKYI